MLEKNFKIKFTKNKNEKYVLCIVKLLFVNRWSINNNTKQKYA